jgi:hypothetical protein
MNSGEFCEITKNAYVKSVHTCAAGKQTLGIYGNRSLSSPLDAAVRNSEKVEILSDIK